MSNKKNNKHNNNLPFNNSIAKAKHEFKQAIDDMPDDVFVDFCFSLQSYLDIFDEDWIEEQWAIDEGWEDEAEAFYNHYKHSDDNLTLFDDDSLPF